MEPLLLVIDKALNSLDHLFGCKHKIADRMGPFTERNRTNDATYTYVVCGKCSKQAEYSLEDMCIVTPAYLRMKRRLAAREAALKAQEENANARIGIAQHAVV
jgi:hypothetical protein